MVLRQSVTCFGETKSKSGNILYELLQEMIHLMINIPRNLTLFLPIFSSKFQSFQRPRTAAMRKRSKEVAITQTYPPELKRAAPRGNEMGRETDQQKLRTDSRIILSLYNKPDVLLLHLILW